MNHPPPTPRSRATALRLLIAAREVTCTEGVAGASARKIASAAGVNQALVFYHFSGVHELIAAASDHFVNASLAQYGERFAQAATTRDLLAIAEELRTAEGKQGNVAFMAQILAAAHIPVIGEAASHALEAWTALIAEALRRLAAETVVPEVLDTNGLAALITAAFVGLELYDGANPSGAAVAGDVLRTLTAVVDSLLAAGPVVRTALSQAARHGLKP